MAELCIIAAMEHQRRTIDHLTKYLVYHNLAPKEMTRFLHKSQLSRYRKVDPANWSGYELAAISWQHFSLLQDFSHDPGFQKVYTAYRQVVLVVTAIAASLKGFGVAMRKQREDVINCIERVQPVVGLQDALMLFNISRTTYYNWLAEIKSKCLDSPFQLCQKRFPNQLTVGEVRKMKELLKDPRFFYWPIVSLYFYSLRKNILNISLSTWYKYNRVLGIRRPKPRSRRKKRKEGIRASKPNEVWHADITRIALGNGEKYYIYLLVDNYSRKILNWRVGREVSKLLRSDMLKETFEAVYGSLKKSITLLVDGGPENSVEEIKLLNINKALQLLQKIALKQIDFSNSIVEAVNKLVKNGYLHHFEISSLDGLTKHINAFIEDYNHERPHCSLKGLTPAEAYQEKKPPNQKFLQQKAAARKDRIAANKAKSCANCAQ